MIKFDKLWLVMEQKGVTTYAFVKRAALTVRPFGGSEITRTWRQKP